MFAWNKYLIVNLVFSHLGLWGGNLFLIAPFPDLCLLVLSVLIILHTLKDQNVAIPLYVDFFAQDKWVKKCPVPKVRIIYTSAVLVITEL